MKKAVVLLIVVAAIAQTPSPLIPVWTGQSYVYAKLGQGLSLVNGVLSITGAIGPQGPAGQTGAQGPQGPAGPAGQTGAQGAQGNPGGSGPPGPPGQSAPSQHFDTLLTYNQTAGAWSLPAGAAQVYHVRLNGQGVMPSIDYSISGGTLKFLDTSETGVQPNFQVVADWQ